MLGHVRHFGAQQPVAKYHGKIKLLKESLFGNNHKKIKDDAHSQNYHWMIETPKKKYDSIFRYTGQCHPETERPSTDTEPQSCETVFEEVRFLVNGMTSSWYPFAETQDPMWTYSRNYLDI
ncbi:hypothetical protein GCK32_022792 [Trichostrongylus colubriformis]|uniref:Uncharacterized protein n=1 Tax=Trichostrongylus colubriformis TaxID=6319 RepID=A0AAN8G659_TRICO